VDAPVYLLVALGNPGPEYQFNRHNAEVYQVRFVNPFDTLGDNRAHA